MNKWMRVEDGLPEKNQRVNCTDGSSVYLKCYEYGIFYDADTNCYCPIQEIKNITHWTPLPKLPEKL